MHYSSHNVLQQVWVATIEVGMATWKAINSLKSTCKSNIQDSIDHAFKVEWCHLNIFGEDGTTIVWRFLPPLYFQILINVVMGLLPPSPPLLVYAKGIARRLT